MKKFDYKGKEIFVGIDVHKKTYTVAVICEGSLVKRDSITASPKKLTDYLSKFFPEAKIKSAYEAGFSGYYLHRHLIEHGIKNIVVHPAAIEISSANRVKTDKRDALKIATQLSVNRLKGIHIPTPEEEDNREVSRLRETLVQKRSKVANQLKHKGLYYGFINGQDTKKVSSKWIHEFLQNPLGPELRFCIETLAEEWHALNNKIKEVDKRLKEQANHDKEREDVYRSAKGIGPTAARILSNELGDLSRFSSERDLFSYTGLTPSEYSSGEHRRQGHISRQGKPILRKILVQCSWVAIAYDNSLAKIYQRIATRAGAKRAIVAIARRLIGRLRACFRKNEPYCSSLLELA